MSEIKEKELFIFDWDGTLSTSTLIVAASRIFRRGYNPKNIEKKQEFYKKLGNSKGKGLSLELKQDRSKIFAVIYDFYANGKGKRTYAA